jgi:hypothetical protein
VLARLPDVSDEPAAQSARAVAFGATNYRFDHPEESQAKSATHKLITATGANQKTGLSHQPHAFGRQRVHRRVPRRESPVLPRSNPFAIPSTRLVDTLAPALRFVTLVVLFTAAGIWLQSMSNRPATTNSHSKELPQTASEVPTAPTANTIAPEPPRPTAAGPLETSPQSGARVGRTEGDDFIGQNEPNPAAVPMGHPTKNPPRFLIANGTHVPRVRTSELPKAQSDDTAANAVSAQSNNLDEAPSVARYPGFSTETPTR